MALPSYQDAAFLFGDSITQACSAGSLYQRVAEFYSRRLDVINRGFGGYNSEWYINPRPEAMGYPQRFKESTLTQYRGVPVLETVLSKKVQRDQGCAQQIPIMTIWFGANDAVLPGRPQHVPLERYKSNLSKLARMVKDPSSPYYSPDTRLVLITPPPIVPASWRAHCVNMWRQNGSQGPEPLEDRDPKVTKQYADACIDVAKAEGVEVVDAWSSIVEAAGGSDGERLAPYFYDGLHLTSEGYRVVFESFKKLILSTWTELDPEHMIMPTPHWAMVDPENPRKVLGPKPDGESGARQEA